MPHGAIETGLGGPSGADAGLWLAVLAAGAAAGAVLLAVRRRRVA